MQIVATREAARTDARTSSSSAPPETGLRDEVERLREALARALEATGDAEAQVLCFLSTLSLAWAFSLVEFTVDSNVYYFILFSGGGVAGHLVG